MNFIKITDFKARIKDNVLSTIISADALSAENKTLILAESKAIATVKAYVKDKYNVDHMLTRIDPDRDILLIDIIMNIMIFSLLARTTADMVSDIRSMEYNNSIQMLKDIRDGKVNPEGWPIKNPNFEPMYRPIYNSNQKWNDYEY